MVSADRLAEVFVEVADTLVDDFDLTVYLHMVAQNACELVRAEAAGLLLADHHGQLRLMAATDDRAARLELFQLQTNEGPCQDCFRTGESVIDADLAGADIWPQFAPRAVAAGFLSVHTFPMRLRLTAIGALDLFGANLGQMTLTDVRIVQALIDIATIGLLRKRAIRLGARPTEQRQVTLKAARISRIVIEQAKGVLAQAYSITLDEASDLLRLHARSQRHGLGEVT